MKFSLLSGLTSPPSSAASSEACHGAVWFAVHASTRGSCLAGSRRAGLRGRRRLARWRGGRHKPTGCQWRAPDRSEGDRRRVGKSGNGMTLGSTGGRIQRGGSLADACAITRSHRPELPRSNFQFGNVCFRLRVVPRPDLRPDFGPLGYFRYLSTRCDLIEDPVHLDSPVIQELLEFG